MKLNKEQRYALAFWLGSHVQGLHLDSSVATEFDAFCSGDIVEWRIIHCFGLAGKIWNNNNKIYIIGKCDFETTTEKYKEQQDTIEGWNQEIHDLLNRYA